MQEETFGIVAEIELSYTPTIKPSDRPKITTQESAYRLLLKTWDENKIQLVEQFKVVLLNRAHRVLGICTVSSGNVTGTIADPKMIFAIALKANACSIIVAHNHPSGSTIPSVRDYELTRKIKDAGALLDVSVIDHIIVTTEGYYSFAMEGVL